jgi:3-phosphoshikimate 1-carboxyvinyltransferase
VKSAILLAGLYADGETRVTEPHPTRDYTERMLATFGWPIGSARAGPGVTGGIACAPTDVVVPADYFLRGVLSRRRDDDAGVGAAPACVGMNPRRTGLARHAG